MVTISGGAGHVRRLKRLRGSATKKALGRVIEKGAEQIVLAAKTSISEGAVKGKGHVPSNPGEAPNNATDTLIGGIYQEKTGELTAEAKSTVPHALPLELGAPAINLEARPYMRPAAISTSPAIAGLARNALRKQIKRR